MFSILKFKEGVPETLKWYPWEIHSEGESQKKNSGNNASATVLTLGWISKKKNCVESGMVTKQ